MFYSYKNRILSGILVLLIALCVCAVSSALEEGTCGEGLTWSLDDDLILTISGTGDMDDYDEQPVPWLFSSYYIKEVRVSDGVTSVGRYAFRYLSSLTRVSLPDSVTAIGDYAFIDCSSLADITIPESVTSIGEQAFSGCASLAGITIPESVTSIGLHAFNSCSGLQAVTVPGSVSVINDGTFCGCGGLAEVSVMEGVTAIGEYAFSGCSQLARISLPDSLETVGYCAFQSCDSLEALTLPDGLKEINNYAFPFIRVFANIGSQTAKTLSLTGGFTCPDYPLLQLAYLITDGEVLGLQVVGMDAGADNPSFPQEVTEIGSNAFYSCESLTEITVPGHIRKIGDYAFYGCPVLKSVKLSEGLEEISGGAFISCAGLKKLRIPDSVKVVDTWSFDSDLILYASLESRGAKALGKADWCFRVSGGTYLYSYRYSGEKLVGLAVEKALDKKIKTVELDDRIVVIGVNAFEGCSRVTAVTLPDGLKEIDSYAFGDCKKLKKLTLPNGIEGFGYGIVPDGTVIYARIGSKSAKALGKSYSGFRVPGNDTITLMYTWDSNTVSGLSLIKINKPKSSLKIPKGVTTIDRGVLSEHAGEISCLELPDSVNRLSMTSFAGVNRNFYIKCSKGSYAESFARKNGLQYIAGSTRVIGSDITDVNAKADWVVSSYITPGMSEKQKVRMIHDWLIYNAHYDVTFAAHDAGGVLVRGSGVCESYAKAAQLLLNKAGITNIYVGGSADNGLGGGYQGHAWNAVRINGSWYHMDTTWDDPVMTLNPDSPYAGWTVSGGEGYYYYLLTSDQIGVNHRWSKGLIPETGPELPEEKEDERADIAEAVFSKVKDQVYTGKAIKPAVTVKLFRKKLVEGTDYTVSYKGNRKIGTATITVKGTGNYTGTKKITFRILPEAVRLSGLTAGKKQLKVSWAKGSGITGYEIEYSLKKSFKASKTVTVKKASATGTVIKKLKTGKTYYVRIRAYKTVKGQKYYSAWSDALKKKVK